MSEPGGFFLMGDPEELRKRQEEHIATVQMLNQDFRNKLHDLIVGITPQRLHTLRLVLNRAQRDDGIQYLAFIEGMIVNTLETAYGLCAACGQDHEKDGLGLDCKPTGGISL